VLKQPYVLVNGIAYWGPVNQIVTGTDPAATQEWSATVPAGKVWVVLSVFVTLVTNATSASRYPEVVFDDGTTVFFRSAVGAAQAASQTRRHCWANFGVSVEPAGTPLTNAHALPTVYLLPGYRVRSLTQNLQTGDDWGAPVLYVAEYSS
jgi:hypothetical protein